MRQLIFCLTVLIVSCYKDSNKKVDDDVYARVGPTELTKKDLMLFNRKTPSYNEKSCHSTSHDVCRNYFSSTRKCCKD